MIRYYFFQIVLETIHILPSHNEHNITSIRQEQLAASRRLIDLICHNGADAQMLP